MEFNTLLAIVGDAPVFETGLLLAGGESPDYIRRQLSGWASAGKILQLQRGLYALAPPYQKSQPHPFLVANRMSAGSYVSLQSALGHYGLIPEYVPVTTSVTTTRPFTRDTPLGQFSFRHIRPGLFFGYRNVALGSGQSAFLAAPEKALLDLITLQPGGDDPAYLDALRLQDMGQISEGDLRRMAETIDRPKIFRAIEHVMTIKAREEGYSAL